MHIVDLRWTRSSDIGTMVLIPKTFSIAFTYGKYVIVVGKGWM